MQQSYGLIAVSRMLHCNPATLRRAIAAGELVSRVKGRNLMIDRDALDAYLGDSKWTHWYTVRGVASMLCVCEQTVRREIERGALRFSTVGRLYRINDVSLKTYTNDATYQVDTPTDSRLQK